MTHTHDEVDYCQCDAGTPIEVLSDSIEEPCECESTLCPESHEFARCENAATHDTLWTKECESCWTAKPEEYRASEVKCLEDRGDGSCDGAVEYRYPLSSTGKPFPRCDRHWGKRLVEQDRINRLYSGDCPPSDFDPAYAGERW